MHRTRRHRIMLAVAAVTLPTGLLIACSGPEEESTADVSAVVLTPTSDETTAQTVTWRGPEEGLTVTATARDGDARSTARARAKEPTSVANSGSDEPAHTATLRDLEPDTHYDLSIGGRQAASFRTAADEAGPWSFVALGDTQVDNDELPTDIVAAALEDAPRSAAVLQAGDGIDRPSSGQDWREYLAALAPARTSRDLVMAIGNHEQCILLDDCRHGDAEGYRAYLTHPDAGFEGQRPTWFRFDRQGVRFVVLDSFADDLATQARFLDDSLESNPGRWSVVLLHSGPFASRADRTNKAVADLVLPVVEKHDVDLVLSGHDHVYSRGHRGAPDSTVYVTLNSGPKHYELSDTDWKRRGATQVRAVEQVSTYGVVDVERDSLSLRAVVGGLGEDADDSLEPGDVLDRVEITRDAVGAKTVEW